MIIAFIPIRCGSKSIPFKNIKDFCNKPLVYWNIKALQDSKNIDQIVVATDCIQIKEVVSKFNFSKVKIYDRDQKNAADTSTTESVMLEYIKKGSLSSEDIFVLVQVTSPLTQSIDFDKALKFFLKGKYDSLLSCVRNRRFFWTDKGIPLNYNYAKRPRRQDFNGLFMENGAFYFNKVKNIVKDKNRLSGKIGIYEMPDYTAIELDEEDDWLVAEALMYKHILCNKKSKKKIKLFATDVDGVLTDAGMYYSENGDELKKFNTLDGKGIELLRNLGIKTAIITSENTKIVERRASKLKVDYLYQGIKDKLQVMEELCKKEKITLDEVAYIGDDINDLEVLKNVGMAACPSNAVYEVKRTPGIIKLTSKGGDGAVREFISIILR